MDLKAMTFLELEKEEAQKYASPHLSNTAVVIHSQIFDPLVYPDYESLFFSFLEHPFSHMIKIGRGLEGRITKKRHIQSSNQIKELAALAATKKSCVCLGFKRKECDCYNYPNRGANLFFRETEGGIEVCKAYVRPELSHLFNQEISTYFYTENQATVPGVLSLETLCTPTPEPQEYAEIVIPELPVLKLQSL